MKSTITPTAVFLFVVCCTQAAFAQQGNPDSSHLDLGYFSLRKPFVQQISIKGADLEMMPFTNLSDAIRVWLYGAYSLPTTLQYVVDGNPVADVNAYSIHDIEEVTLVQDAAATMATAPGQAELVIIKTKRGAGPRGVCAAAQTGLIGANKGFYTSTSALFHNYYLSAYRNWKKITLGISGNYLRDALPYASPNTEISSVDYLSRWRLNGYFDWRPNDHHRIELTMNYTPQRWNGLQDTTGQSSSYAGTETGHQHFLLPHLDWRASWGNGWSNHVEGTYVRSVAAEADASLLYFNQSWQGQVTEENSRSHQLWFMDRIGYEARAGNWTIEPSLGLSYQQFENQFFLASGSGAASDYVNLNDYASVTALTAEGKSTVWLLTPTLGFSYKQALDLEGGAMIHAGAKSSLTGNGRQVYPFAGVTIDLLRFSKNSGGNSLKVFGSLASRTQPSVNEYALSDFSTGIDVSFILPNIGFTATPVGFPPAFTSPGPPVYWTWEAGAAYTGWKGRLRIGYNFEKRIGALLGLEPSLVNFQTEGYGRFSSSLHHLDIRVKALDGPGVSWWTGVNVTTLRNRLEFQGTVGLVYPPVGDSPNDTSWTWTGGWVNRVQIRKFSAGLDLLYHFNDLGLYGQKNLATTPNIYVGYRFQLRGNGTLQLFAETRGLFVNSYSDLADARQYYTIGANLCL